MSLPHFCRVAALTKKQGKEDQGCPWGRGLGSGSGGVVGGWLVLCKMREKGKGGGEGGVGTGKGTCKSMRMRLSKQTLWQSTL